MSASASPKPALALRAEPASGLDAARCDPARGGMDDYQAAVSRWMIECFGEVIAMDPLERIMRFLEEALELAQAEGMSEEEVGRVVRYVFSRPQGVSFQEVGGVMVTLAAFCFRRDIDLQAAALAEFDRIDSPEMRRKIFAKQAFKRTQGLTSDSGFRRDRDAAPRGREAAEAEGQQPGPPEEAASP